MRSVTIFKQYEFSCVWRKFRGRDLIACADKLEEIFELDTSKKYYLYVSREVPDDVPAADTVKIISYRKRRGYIMSEPVTETLVTFDFGETDVYPALAQLIDGTPGHCPKYLWLEEK